MKKCLHYDWLRAVLFYFFFLNSAETERVNSVQKEETNQAFWLANDQLKKLTDGESNNLLLSNQAHAMDGAIDGAIFPWLRDTRAHVYY